MNNELDEIYFTQLDKEVSEHIYMVDKTDIKKVAISDEGDMQVIYTIDGVKWTGALMGIELDKKGEVKFYYVEPY